MSKFILSIILAISCLLNEYSAHDVDPPIQQLANILTFFKTAELCEHVAQVYVWYGDDQRWDVRFKVTLGPSERAEAVCKCMYDYINQNNWLGAECDHTCIASPNCATLVLQGPSSPNFDPIKPPVVKPISSLCNILQNFKSADLGDHVCTSKCSQSGQFTRLELHCELTCDSPSPPAARDMIVAYLNQSGLLAKATITANSDGKFINVIVLGD